MYHYKSNSHELLVEVIHMFETGSVQVRVIKVFSQKPEYVQLAPGDSYWIQRKHINESIELQEPNDVMKKNL